MEPYTDETGETWCGSGAICWMVIGVSVVLAVVVIAKVLSYCGFL